MEITIGEIMNLISGVGFPIVITLFFMFKTNKAIENNTNALTEMKETIQKCKKGDTNGN